jgi:hypothetical protein
MWYAIFYKAQGSIFVFLTCYIAAFIIAYILFSVLLVYTLSYTIHNVIHWHYHTYHYKMMMHFFTTNFHFFATENSPMFFFQ